MKHYCPMCGEQWNDDECATCGWREGKQTRYSQPRRRRRLSQSLGPKPMEPTPFDPKQAQAGKDE